MLDRNACRLRRTALTVPAPPPAPRSIRPLLAAGHLVRDGPSTGEGPVRGPPERDSQARGDVTDCVERLIVRDDLDDVARTGAGEPHAGRHRDPQIAPVAHADGRGAVHERSAVMRQ